MTQLRVRTELTVKGIITIKKQKTFAEWSSSVPLPKWPSVLLLISAAARSGQVIVAASRAELDLRNSIISWASKKSSLFNDNLFCSLFPTLICKFASLVPLISQPASRSLFQPLSLFLPLRETKCCCCGNRFQRGSLWDFQGADRSLYMAISCLSTNRWVQPSMNIEPFNQTDGVTDRESKRQ